MNYRKKKFYLQKVNAVSVGMMPYGAVIAMSHEDEYEECIFCKCNGCDFCDDYRKPCNYCYQGNEQIGSCLKANRGGAK